MGLRWIRRGFEVKAVSPAHLERRVSGFTSAVRARGGVVVAVERNLSPVRAQDHRAEVLFELPLAETPQPKSPEGPRGPSVRKCEVGAATAPVQAGEPVVGAGSLREVAF